MPSVDPPMPNGHFHALRETEGEQAFKRFTHRFYGFAEDAWRKQCRDTIAQAADDKRLPAWAA